MQNELQTIFLPTEGDNYSIWQVHHRVIFLAKLFFVTLHSLGSL